MDLQKRFFLIVLVVTLILAGCSVLKKKDKASQESPEELYAKALSRLNRGKYQRAIELFQDVKNYHPESPEALRAEIKIADAHFLLVEYEEAVVIYEEFRKLHPSHEDIPYVLFQIGQVYFKQMKSSDRDPAFAQKALSNFQYLVDNYPPSIFTEKAREKIPVCRQSFAEHEFSVGMFYYKKEKYQGAVARFEGVLDAFPDTDIAPKALYYMGKAFMELSLPNKAKEAFLTITSRYSGSDYAERAKEILRDEWNETGTTTRRET